MYFEERRKKGSAQKETKGTKVGSREERQDVEQEIAEVAEEKEGQVVSEGDDRDAWAGGSLDLSHARNAR